ncbi:hypothetical protein JW935_07360, partial [candidate division KSB1 bacterium]|nr:hypothetical protein [candidate division KSB1 bacterium]
MNRVKSLRMITGIFSYTFFLPIIGLSNQTYWIPRNPPKAQYEISAKIDTLEKKISGRETITLKNTSTNDITVLAINWSLDSKSDIFIFLDGEILPVSDMNKNGVLAFPLIYPLPSPLKPGEKVRLVVEFSSAGQIRNTREIALTGWHPRLWWDGIDTYDSYKVKLDYPQNYALAVSGRLNKKTGFYEHDGIRNCGIYLRLDLLVKQKMIEDVLVTAYFTQEGSDCAKLCLKTAVDVIRFYKQWLGFFPFKFLNIIPGADRPMGGFPFAPGIVVIHGQEKFDEMPFFHWQWITAHEIGHQYWGEYVFDDENSWLWIGLGVYADREYSLYREIGTEKHSNMMKRYLWGVENQYDTFSDLTAFQIREISFDYNNVIKHGKGFSIISALECVLGKHIFFHIYRRCLDEYAGKYLNYRDFWRICEQESGQDLTWFFEQWVRSNDFLSYGIVSQKSIQEGKRYISHVKIKRFGSLKMPVPVKATFKDGTSEIKYTDRLFDVNFLVFESSAELKEAVIDPENKLAMIRDTLFVSSGELKEKISRLPWSNAGGKAVELFNQAQEIKLKDFRSWYKLGLALFNSGNDEKVLYSMQQAYESDPNDFGTIVWLGHMHDLKGEREKAIEYYKLALQKDTGETLRHDQWR